MSEPVPVVQAIAAVAADLGAVAKGRKSQGYSYRGIDDVMNSIHGPMADHGLIIIPNLIDHQITDVTVNNKPWAKHLVTIRFDVHGPAGDTISGTVCAEGLDNSDKGTGKAFSYAFKTFACQLFSLPTEDPAMDNEHVPAVVDHIAPPTAAPLPEISDEELAQELVPLNADQLAEFKRRMGAKGWATIADIPQPPRTSVLRGIRGLADWTPPQDAASGSAQAAAQPGPKATQKTITKLAILAKERGLDKPAIEDFVSDLTDGRTTTRTELTRTEASELIDTWEALPKVEADG